MENVYHIHVTPNGRCVIPVELRRYYGLDRGGELIVTREPTEMRWKPKRQVIAEAQDYFAEGLTPGTLVSSELIQDRRDEAARE